LPHVKQGYVVRHAHAFLSVQKELAMHNAPLPTAFRHALRAILAAWYLLAGPCSAADTLDLRQQVIDVEHQFAASMARRDLAAFTSLLSEETVFFSGNVATRGKTAVALSWKALFEKPDAPFSWEPAQVEVLDSGTLAISSGPVRDAQGETFATFTSIWRLEAPGTWRIVFDKGNPVCRCQGK
jgi:ketosteroid isomerase-like protein